MARSLARLTVLIRSIAPRLALGLIVAGWLFLPACDCQGGGAADGGGSDGMVSDAGDDGGASDGAVDGGADAGTDGGDTDGGGGDGSVTDGGDPDGGADGGGCADLDGDGHTDVACGGTDCDDGNPEVNPDATEICNGIDDDCVAGIDDGGDTLCDDGRFCSGTETCAGLAGCQPGTAPACDDGVSCTVDACDPGTDACASAPDDAACNDGNACTTNTCDPAAGCQTVDADGAACSVGACNGVCGGGLCGGCACVVDGDCNDGVACTADTCNGGACLNVPVDPACDDGDFCNGAERCSALLGCQPGTPPSCDDGVGCTSDACTAGACVNTPADVACDDGTFCNGAETCDAILDCQAGSVPACDDGVGCTADTCDAATDACASTPVDAACDDGAFCNGAETCNAVSDCVPGTAPVCDDGVPCTVDACDAATDACAATPDDGACDDGNACTADTCDLAVGCQSVDDDGIACSVGACNGTCGGGLCGGCTCNVDGDCDDGVACTTDTCSAGACLNVPVDAACDDGTFCNGAETCDAALDCQAGTPPTCDDGVGCTTDTCDGATDACAYAPVDAACDDGTFCNGAETCDAALDCQAGTPPTCDDGVGCTTDTCDGAADACAYAPVDAACDDGTFCNGAEICDAALDCQAGTPPTCDDGVGCTTDTCDGAADACAYAPVDAACDDGTFCNGAETCDAALDCQAGTPPTCDDGVGCTTDTCDGATDACAYAPVDAACDDGTFCNGAETCDAALDCQAGTPPTCDDGVGCTTDTCDGATDACAYAPVDAACDDGTFCNGAETCDAALDCQAGTAPTCDDGVGCTTDTCDGATDACAYAPVDAACDDGTFCNGAETCDAALDCQAGTPPTCDDGVGCTTDTCDGATDACAYAPVDAACDDGTFCNGAETCDAALDCQAGTAPTCDDGVGCTTDTCDGATDACAYAPVDAVCDDGTFCNGAETCDAALDCQAGTPPTCDDGVGCTTDTCDGATDACAYAPVDAACDDGTFCNGAETCDAALDCQAGTPPTCDDTVACTVDTCDGGLDACFSTPDDLQCAPTETCDLFLGCIGGGDSCTAPIPIPGTGTYSGDTTTGFGTHTGSCGGAGPELVYELTLGGPSDVYVDTAGSAFDTVLHLRVADCAAGVEQSCNDDAEIPLTTSRLELPALGAGTYYLFADSASAGGALTLNVVVTPVGFSTTPAVADDPLLRMPGTQPADGVALEAVGRCLNCHDGYDAAVEPGSHWKGTMMAQASRDPLFWATFAVGVQDSVWLMGNANAGDLCLRCHFPRGWLAGRSSDPTGGAMIDADYEGVSCDTCHRMYDPFHEDTWAGTREGNDWAGYWDESGASGTPSQAAADTTRAADQTEAAALTLFNGNPAFDGSSRPVNPGWTEASSAQMFVAAASDKRASFADATGRHGQLYSRYHKSKYMCAACHDVSNPVLANLAFAGTPPGDGTTILPTEAQTAASYGHVERTFSEFMLSDYGLPGGAAGTGAYAPGVFTTSTANDFISRCQDCHLPDGVGKGCDKNDGILRPTGSVEHPQCGQPVHDLTGGNAWIPWLLASAVPGSPNYDPTNQALLDQGPAALTLDLSMGEPLDAGDLLAASSRAIATLQKAATVENVVYDPATGALDFRIDNHTGHKLITGYPEGRRLFVNVRVLQGATLLQEVNPYDATAGTLKGLPYPGSPALGPGETHDDALVYESHPRSALTGEDHTFHFVLATDRYKDNRIPPKGFRIAEAAGRMSEPAWAGGVAPGYFTAAEYAGGWDDVSITVAPGATAIEVRVYYQVTSREYIEFLRDEILGTGATLPSPTPSGRALGYVLQTDPALSGLAAWGDTMWQLWDRNKNAPGAAPVECAQGVWP